MEISKRGTEYNVRREEIEFILGQCGTVRRNSSKASADDHSNEDHEKNGYQLCDGAGKGEAAKAHELRYKAEPSREYSEDSEELSGCVVCKSLVLLELPALEEQ